MRDVSVNETTGVLYVAESGLEELLVYEPLGGGVYELVQNVSLEGEGFLYVAVDNSGGAHEGDVYVTAQLGETAHVYIFETNVKGELGAKEELTPPEGGFSLINQDNGDGGVAVNGTNGDVYLPETEHGVVTVYGPEGSLLKTVDGTETPDESFEPIGVAIDESTGEILRDRRSAQSRRPVHERRRVRRPDQRLLQRTAGGRRAEPRRPVARLHIRLERDEDRHLRGSRPGRIPSSKSPKPAAARGKSNAKSTVAAASNPARRNTKKAPN